MEGDIKECASDVSQLILNAALNSSSVEGKRKTVP